jgi:REP element-mobilizing transposase RayT
MKSLRTDYAVRILGYVIMPDHVHLVLDPPAGIKLGVVIGQMKARVAHTVMPALRDRLLRPDGHPALWERRCYDHNCRSILTVREKIIYCHNNPVRRGLVGNPGDWLWSSYRWYQGGSNSPLDIDGIEL